MRRRLQEATEYDIILSVMNELTHTYVDGRETSSYFNISEITDNYGLSPSEVIDIAENNGYNVYRIPGGENLVDKVVIAHEDLSYGDIVREDTTKVDIDELGKETDNSFNMEEDYMEDVKPFTQRQIFDELKRETNNFTKEDIFRYYFFEEQRMAVKILEKHYDDVDYWSDEDRFAIDHTAYFVQFREPKKGKKRVVKEDKETQEYRDYKLVFHPGYNLWVNMRDYWKVYDAKGTLVGSVKTIDDAKKLVDKRIENKSDIYESANDSLVGKKVTYKDSEVTIEEVEEEDDDTLLTLSNGKKVSVKICVERNIISSNDSDVQQLLNKYTSSDVIDEPKEKSDVDVFTKDGVIKMAIADAQRDWEENKPGLSSMYERIKKALNKHDFSNVPTAQPENYAVAYKDEYDRLRGKKKVENGLNRYSGIIEQTYPGDVDELIAWLRDAITNIWVSCGEDVLKSTQKKVDWFNERDNTNAKVSIQKNKIWSSWIADLTQKEEILKNMPKEVSDWVVDKNSGLTIDEWEPGKVYNKVNNYISSNPIVIDLLYEYDFKLGVQKSQNSKDESLEEDIEKHVKDTFDFVIHDEDGNKYSCDSLNDLKDMCSDLNVQSIVVYDENGTKNTFETVEDVEAFCKGYFEYTNESIEKHDELICKVAEKLKNNINNFEDELITLSQIDGVDVEEIKQREPMQIAKALVEEGIVDSRMFEDIEKHDTLNPKLFEGEELKPEIKDKIEQIANQFVRELNEDGIRFTLKDIVLLGSNVSYNYTKDSDLDIHLIADSSGFECPEELYDKLYGAYRSIFNKNYNITLKGIPAEIYVELDEPMAKSNGIYSINNGWIKKPEQTTIPDLNEEEFDKLFTKWEDSYFDLIEKEYTSKDIEDFIEDIYLLRKDSIATEGEYGIGNLVFKEFRNLGYLDNLKDLRKQCVSKELSLEHLEEELKKTNASKLFKLLNTKVNELNVILSEDVEDRKIDDEKAYNSAKEEVEKGINVEGMWTNPETKEAIAQPNSYIIKCDLDKAKELAKALCQLEFITVEFDDENNFNSKLYHVNDNGYNEIENSSEVVFDDDAKVLPYYSIIDGVAFSLGLYGNNFNLDEDKKMRRDKYYVVNQDCSDWFTSLKQAIKEIKAGYFGDERTIIYYISNEYTQEYGNDMSQLGIDDELMEFENCKLVKDYRKHK